MEDIDFDFILKEIDELYNDYETEYEAYIKTRQILPYKPIDNILLTAIYCYTALFNFSLFYKNNI
tara:strand:- start:215 stop:409 length:195 start_codon:yes stop_codon:yes gene_type:complete